MDLNEALYTTRAMRRVKPDPVPEDVVKRMLDAAIRSPSGGNTQNWRFVTVTRPDLRAEMGRLYAEAWVELNRTVYAGKREQAEQSGDEQTVRVMRSSQWLADHFGEVPLVVLAYHRNDPTGASIYPAVWNLMLAARGAGVGTTLTTILGAFRHDEVAALLGVPVEKGWRNAAAVPCGYPLGRWGLAKRAPAQAVTYADEWGSSPEWTIDEPLWGPR
jgi:nitroreductase